MNIYKPHPNFIVKSLIEINFSAGQWGLDTENFSRVVIERVASSLNQRITYSYNRGDDRDELIAGFNALINHFEIYGSKNKQVRVMFDRVIRVLYDRSNHEKDFLREKRA